MDDDDDVPALEKVMKDEGLTEERTMTKITVTDERAACWSDDVTVTSAPVDGRPLVRDGVRSITTSDPQTIAWAQRYLGGAVEIEPAG